MRSWRRIVSLVFVSALLLSCVSVGVANVQKAKAIAVADDYAMLAEALKVIVTYACSAAELSHKLTVWNGLNSFHYIAIMVMISF